MNFDIAIYLGRATSRAKSDVANKMVSMFLHDVSRRIVAETGLRVTDLTYGKAVYDAFGDQCVYCRRPLELNRAAVEHLDGMNRFRAGLHIPGNVTVSCVTCNREKRRDDQLQTLLLAESGWESFIEHNGQRCSPECKTCRYWRGIWPDPNDRVKNLKHVRSRIQAFRRQYSEALKWSSMAHLQLRDSLEFLYRECQDFAVSKIAELADASFAKMSVCRNKL